MGNTTSLYGSIGYTYLRNDVNNPKFILVLSDNHSKLPYCNNYKMISDWLKEKSLTNNILLEEVPRNNVLLKELFAQSDHTQKLKELFINNPELIHGIDIRPMLIKFSWEILELTNMPDITLELYLEEIDIFFNFYNENYNKDSKCYTQFKTIQNIYLEYKDKYNIYFNHQLLNIFNTNKFILEELNIILDNIMEFYTILNAFNSESDKKNIIIHTGLVHAEKIVFWLTSAYSYNIVEEKGITNIETIETMPITNGCLELSKTIDNQLSTINYN
jgi:hypothetical protein